ncbi:hypothetical protein EV672_1153 [Aquabacterium commune]|uniref:Excisionase family DNA binding protein n=1 Tax=Aquabacterium commune TaxID=70586 RepID=A0A4R6R103_9BURK|nr:hypothetical protein [Aquabacterium commune]TDP79332.1 hypothetical protein EV672_1153 [Aquabacterium commune]
MYPHDRLTVVQPTTLELLQRQGQPALICLKDAARISGVAVQTLRNQISLGRCQLKTIKRGGRRFVRLQDLAEFIDGSPGGNEPTVRRTGRLTKREEIERRNGRC